MSTPKRLRAYNDNPALKTDLLNQMRGHREADTLVVGQYWKGGKGCAVGCLTKNRTGGHKEYEKWGIPKELACLEDVLFEGLPYTKAFVWPERFLSAIPVGADLSGVWHRWCAETLRMDLLPLKEVQEDKAATAAIEAVAVLHEKREVDRTAWDAAWYAAVAVARGASGDRALRVIYNAAYGAAWNASRRSVLHVAQNTLWHVVESTITDAAGGASQDATWIKMASRLVRLLKKA